MEFKINYQLLNANPAPGKFLAFRNYEEEFSSIIVKKEAIGEVNMKLGDTLLDIKKKVSEKTHFPVEVMSFGIFSHFQIETNTDIIDYYLDEKNNPIQDSTLIKDSIYNNTDGKKRMVYIYIDIFKSQKFKFLNDNTNIVDIKRDITGLKYNYDELEKYLDDKIGKNSSDIFSSKRKINTLESNLNDMKKKYNNLSEKNEENKTEIKNMKKEKENLEKKIEEQNNNIFILKTEINNLKIKLEEEIQNNKDLKEKEKQKEITCKNSFNLINNNINLKILNEFKTIIFILKSAFFDKIEKNLINDFFLKYLFNNMDQFVTDFIKYNENYLDTFEKKKQKILEEYNEIKIEYLNIIVIGKEGQGKSTLINAILKLEGDKQAKEVDGETGTEKVNRYISPLEELKSIRMYDTPGSGFKNDLNTMLEDVNKLINLKENNNNIVFFCESIESSRFNKEEVSKIEEIMGLYGNYDLPVIIVITKSYGKKKPEEKKNKVMEILKKYLNKKELFNKIEIMNVLAKNYESDEKTYSAYGLEDLIKKAFDMKIKNNSIINENISRLDKDMEKFKTDLITNKTTALDKIMKKEEEYIKQASSKEDTSDNNYLVNKYWTEYLKEKIINIYNILNNIDDNPPNNNLNSYLDEKIQEISYKIDNIYNELYTLLEKNRLLYYFVYMQKEQMKLNAKNETKNLIEDIDEKENKLKNELTTIFDKEFYESFTCGIIKIFYSYLKKNLDNKFKDFLDKIKIEDQKEKLLIEINNLKNSLNKK